MYRRGSAHLCCKCSAYIQEGNGFAKCEDNEPWSIPSSIDAAGGLENFGGAGVNVRRAVQDRAVLLDGYAMCVWQMMVPASGGRAEAAKLIPARGMGTTSEVDTPEVRAGGKNQGLRGDAAERRNARRLGKFDHECSGARQIACKRNDCIDWSPGQQPFAWAQRRGVTIQLEVGIRK
jgi:hypothetical protein